MFKRVFIAIPIPQEFASKVENFVKKNFSNLKLRILSKKDLHITLVPPWYEKDVESTYLKVRNLSNLDSFKISLNKISFGTNLSKPRLIWAKGETNENLINLKSKLDDILSKNKEKKSFLTHLTLARFRFSDFENFSLKNLEIDVNWNFIADSFAIFESKLTPFGARYKILHKIPLKPFRN